MSKDVKAMEEFDKALGGALSKGSSGSQPLDDSGTKALAMTLRDVGQAVKERLDVDKDARVVDSLGGILSKVLGGERGEESPSEAVEVMKALGVNFGSISQSNQASNQLLMDMVKDKGQEASDLRKTADTANFKVIEMALNLMEAKNQVLLQSIVNQLENVKKTSPQSPMVGVLEGVAAEMVKRSFDQVLTPKVPVSPLDQAVDQFSGLAKLVEAVKSFIPKPDAQGTPSKYSGLAGSPEVLRIFLEHDLAVAKDGREAERSNQEMDMRRQVLKTVEALGPSIGRLIEGVLGGKVNNPGQPGQFMPVQPAPGQPASGQPASGQPVVSQAAAPLVEKTRIPAAKGVSIVEV